MKAGKPSVTARFVANTRASLERPRDRHRRRCRRAPPLPVARLDAVPAETKNWRDRMERRTRFFDRLTIGRLEAGLTQVVIVGAGYDGRPIRFASPGVTWYEVDHPSTQSDKRARLDSRPGPTWVPSVSWPSTSPTATSTPRSPPPATTPAGRHCSSSRGSSATCRAQWPTALLRDLATSRGAGAAGWPLPSRSRPAGHRPPINSATGCGGAWWPPSASRGSTSTPRRRWTRPLPPAAGRSPSSTTHPSATRARGVLIVGEPSVTAIAGIYGGIARPLPRIGARPIRCPSVATATALPRGHGPSATSDPQPPRSPLPRPAGRPPRRPPPRSVSRTRCAGTGSSPACCSSPSSSWPCASARGARPPGGRRHTAATADQPGTPARRPAPRERLGGGRPASGLAFGGDVNFPDRQHPR